MSAYWIILLCAALILPLKTLISGLYLVNHVPKKIGSAWAYRSEKSTINFDTWVFASKHCGELWPIVGAVLLLLTVAVMIFLLGKPTKLIFYVVVLTFVVQAVALTLSNLSIESALNKNFYPNGRRRI